MSLYAISDFHLALSQNKPMDIFGDRWINHAEKINEGFVGISDGDTVVIVGDLSWGMSLDECLEDFKFINSLPGKKILVKGNHDYYWTTVNKMKKFFIDNNLNSFEILNNNSFSYNNVSICGTRGWFYEIDTGGLQDRKIFLRELQRLKRSLDCAQYKERIVFLHYPPIYHDYRCEEILSILKEYEVRNCIYGHIHGNGLKYLFNGWTNSCKFTCVSADYINFKPIELIHD